MRVWQAWPGPGQCLFDGADDSGRLYLGAGPLACARSGGHSVQPPWHVHRQRSLTSTHYSGFAMACKLIRL